MDSFKQIEQIEKSKIKKEEKQQLKKSYKKMKKTGYIVAGVIVSIPLVGIGLGFMLENLIIILVSMLVPFIVLFIYALLAKKLFPGLVEYYSKINGRDISGLGLTKEQCIEVKKLENKKKLLIAAIIIYIVLETHICYTFDINPKSIGAMIVTAIYVLIICYLFKKCENKINQIKSEKNK